MTTTKDTPFLTARLPVADDEDTVLESDQEPVHEDVSDGLQIFRYGFRQALAGRDQRRNIPSSAWHSLTAIRQLVMPAKFYIVLVGSIRLSRTTAGRLLG